MGTSCARSFSLFLRELFIAVCSSYQVQGVDMNILPGEQDFPKLPKIAPIFEEIGMFAGFGPTFSDFFFIS